MRAETVSTEIVPFKESRTLAGLAAKLPAVFQPDEKAAERFSVSSPRISATGTLGLPAHTEPREARGHQDARRQSFDARIGLTDCLKSDGSLSEARRMANHADTRAMQLYDRRRGCLAG